MFPLRMFYTPEGVWFRVEHYPPGSEGIQLSIKEIETVLNDMKNYIAGIPSKPFAGDVKRVLERLSSFTDIEKIQRFDLTYVMYSFQDEPARPWIICRLWGVTTDIPSLDGSRNNPRVTLFWDLDNDVIGASNELL